MLKQQYLTPESYQYNGQIPLSLNIWVTEGPPLDNIDALEQILKFNMIKNMFFFFFADSIMFIAR